MSEITEPVPGYKILDNLGEGGFARVFLAEQTALERNVALKVMSPKLANDVEYCERFLREGKTLAKLSDHADIVTIFDIGQAGQFYYMAMEYLGGPNLQQRIGDTGYQGDVSAVLRSVAAALQHAHRSGVIHRDIKPGNVLFRTDGSAVLSDFGIAKSASVDNTLTMAGAQIGTPTYMSPEQCKGDIDIDGRADLYSLGAMLYEMLTGKKPYTAADPMGIMLAHISEPIPELPTEHSNYQPLLNRLMAKQRDDRYASADAFLADLAALQSGAAAGSPSAASGSSSRSPWRALFIGAAGAAVATLALVGWQFFSIKEEAPLPVAVPSAGLSEEMHDKVQRLLDSAQMHEVVGRFVAPPGSNALEAYQMVVEIDAANEFAIEKIRRLEAEHN
jgi:serine/threonine-protein kinase PpkA